MYTLTCIYSKSTSASHTLNYVITCKKYLNVLNTYNITIKSGWVLHICCPMSQWRKMINLYYIIYNSNEYANNEGNLEQLVFTS